VDTVEPRAPRALSPSRTQPASVSPPTPAILPAWAWRALGALGGAGRLQADYRDVAALPTPDAFIRAALLRLQIRTAVSAADLERVPATGSLVIVANHPCGGADGLVLLDALLHRRADLRLLANRHLRHLAPLAALLFPIDNLDPRRHARSNASQLRAALRWVKDGGALLMFPAGVVSHLDLRAGCVVDPPWSASAARLLRATRADVLPVHVAGRNSDAFQIAGVVHPLLRTLMLPGELQNKRGAELGLRIGEPWSAARIARTTADEALAAALRLEVYTLAAGGVPEASAPRREPDAVAPVAGLPDAALIAAEVARLPPSSLLASCGTLDVHAAPARSIPALLAEIGRLRELTFRRVGEGTGRERDLDRFDQHYDHLPAWDRRASRAMRG